MSHLLSLVLVATVGQNAVDPRLGDLVSFDRKAAKKTSSWLEMSAVEDEARREAARRAIAAAMAKYPADALLRRVKAVYVLDRMWTSKAFVGGTSSYDGRMLLLTAGGGQKVDEAWMERCFHHELAHVLKEKAGRDFPAKAWREALPKDWKYPVRVGDNDLILTQYGGKERYDPSLFEQGFLCKYGTATIEEDWAMYAEALLSYDVEVFQAAASHPLVKAKLLAVAAFYRKVMPGIWPNDTEEAK